MRRMPDALLTSPQVGAILGKSARTIARMADAGDLPYVQKLDGANGRYLFDPEVIEEERTKRVEALRSELAAIESTPAPEGAEG